MTPEEQRALSWLLREGNLLIPRGWNDSLATIGVLGAGHSVDTPVTPNETIWQRVGEVDRVMVRLSHHHRLVLSLAWGDEGAAATRCELAPHLRWRAVAHLTTTAIERAEAWAAYHPQTHWRGSKSKAWLHKMLAIERPSHEQRAMLEAVRNEARQLLRDAEDAFARCWREQHQGRPRWRATGNASD